MSFPLNDLLAMRRELGCPKVVASKCDMTSCYFFITFPQESSPTPIDSKNVKVFEHFLQIQ